MKDTNQNYPDLAASLVEYAQKQGSTQSQVSIADGTSFNVSVRNGEIEQLKDAGSTGLSLKVIVENKTATASSSDLRPDTLHKLIDNAIQRAGHASADPFGSLPEKEELKASIDSLMIYDPKTEELSPEAKIASAKKLESICLADKRIKLSLGSFYSTSVGSRYLAGSNGFSSSYRYSSCYYGIELQAGNSDNLFEDGWWDQGRSPLTLMHEEQLAEIAINRVTRLIGAKKVKTQNAPVVMEPAVAAEMLDFLTECLYGRSIYMKRSFLTGNLGEKIASDIVDIDDDGLKPGAPGTIPFDAEGVPTRRTTVIEKGYLRSYLLDTYSARKLGMRSTGNASGNTNFILAPGKLTKDDIIKSVDSGLLLTRTIGQGTVATTGDISKGAFGLWIEKGEPAYPVAEITISGSLGSLLKNIELIGNDIDYSRSIATPTIKIKEMTISGT